MQGIVIMGQGLGRECMQRGNRRLVDRGSQAMLDSHLKGAMPG